MNGAIFYTSLLQYGSVATYICYEGFIPDNTSTTRTCTANGWSGYEFLCRGKCFNLLNDIQTGLLMMLILCLCTGLGCKELTVTNGIVSYTDHLHYGSVATYTCNKSYTPIYPDAFQICTLNGWIGPDFTCRG